MRSDMEWLSLVGPLERLGHGAIEVRDEIQDFVSEVVSGGEVASPQQLTDQYAQPKLHLVQPRRVLRRVMEDDAVRGVGQKRGSRCHRFQNAALLLDAEVVGDTRDLRHVAHEALGAVRVQVVRDDMPLSYAWVALDGAANVGQKVDFGSRRSDRWADDFPSNHIKVDHERQGAMADVLELPSFDLAWPHRQAWRGPLQGLDTSHLIGANGSFAGSHTRWRFPIRGAHVGDPLIPLFGRLVGG